jgi:hypothetical protein
LDAGRREYFVAEIAAKLVGSAQIDPSTTEKLRKLSLHSSQIEEAGCRLVGMELNKEVDVAILPKLALQSGTEEGEFPYPISFAEIGNLVPGESNTAFLAHLGTLLLRSPIEFNHVGTAINGRRKITVMVAVTHWRSCLYGKCRNTIENAKYARMFRF